MNSNNPNDIRDSSLALTRTLKRKQHVRRFPELTWSVVPVKNGEREEGSVAVGSKRGLGQGGQVVHVVESWTVCVIVARQQQVHVIRSLGGVNTGLIFRRRVGGLRTEYMSHRNINALLTPINPE